MFKRHFHWDSARLKLTLGSCISTCTRMCLCWHPEGWRYSPQQCTLHTSVKYVKLWQSLTADLQHCNWVGLALACVVRGVKLATVWLIWSQQWQAQRSPTRASASSLQTSRFTAKMKGHWLLCIFLAYFCCIFVHICGFLCIFCTNLRMLHILHPHILLKSSRRAPSII